MNNGYETSRRRENEPSFSPPMQNDGNISSQNGRLLDTDSFKAELQRHRARLERAGWPFTLLTFSLPDSDGIRKEKRRLKNILAKTIAEQCRITDVAGWNGSQVGLLLPGASPNSVESIVSKVEKHFHETITRQSYEYWKNIELSCNVVYYPVELSEKTYISIRTMDV